MWTALSAPPTTPVLTGSALLPVPEVLVPAAPSVALAAPPGSGRTALPVVGIVGSGLRAGHAQDVLASVKLLALASLAPPTARSRGLDVVLVAVDDPGAIAEGLLEARALSEGAKLVVLSHIDDPVVLVSAVSAGVDGWILPGTGAAETADRLVRVARGESGFCHVVTTMLVTALRAISHAARPHVAPAVVEPVVVAPVVVLPDGLTLREREVHQALGAGQSVREIAQALALSEVTVRWHAGRASKKLKLLASAGVDGVAPLTAPAAAVVPVVPVVSAVPAVRAVPLVRAVAAGRTAAAPRPVRHPELGRAETRVALLVADGLSNPEIAERLCISRHTVESHLKQIFVKLGVRSRVDLARRMLTTRQTA